LVGEEKRGQVTPPESTLKKWPSGNTVSRVSVPILVIGIQAANTFPVGLVGTCFVLFFLNGCKPSSHFLANSAGAIVSTQTANH